MGFRDSILILSRNYLNAGFVVGLVSVRSSRISDRKGQICDDRIPNLKHVSLNYLSTYLYQALLWIRIRIQWGPQIFWSVVCSLSRAEGFSCRLDVLYGGLGISKLQF